MDRKALAFISALVFSILGALACKDRFFDNPYDPDAQAAAYEIVATLPLSGIVPQDLTFSGDLLWVVDTFSRILALNYNTGNLIRELNVSQAVNGICYDGSDFWLTVKNSPQIVKVSIINGEILKVLNLVRGDFWALDHYGGKLYVSDRLSNSILVVDSETGNVEQTIPNPGFSLDGVAFDGIYLWLCDASQIRLFRLAADGSLLNIYQAPSRTPAGLASVSGILWCGDQTGKIHKLSFK